MDLGALRYSAMAAAAAGIGLLLVSASAQGQNGASAPPPAQTTPPWAYPVNPPPAPGAQPARDDGAPKHVPNSTVALAQPQIRDLFNPPDWHPDNHPPMPDIVAHGRKPDVRACGYCHLPNGQGRPENAPLAGLPAGYIEQQMADWRNGLRKCSEPRMGPPAAMLTIGKNANEAEAKSAAEYFASMQYKPWIRVIETDSVPKTVVSGSMLVVVEGGNKEPIGHRVIETPEDLERTELRDSASSFIAYVPKGSIEKGESLVVKGGGGKTIRCATCHGADLKGLGNVPPLAGRSPSYIVRQLYDIQHGSRNGPWTQLMKEAVARLTVDDMVSIAAYTASRKP
jgi:cytochrome c553